MPKIYKLMSYQAHDVHDASSSYVPPNLMRTLRTGAEVGTLTYTVRPMEILLNETKIKK